MSDRSVSRHCQLVGRVVRRLRERRGNRMTQQAFADRAGISRGFLADIECGRKDLSVDTLVKIARAGKVTPDYLLGFSARPARW